MFDKDSLPLIIQAGMGAAVSDWKLTNKVSCFRVNDTSIDRQSFCGRDIHNKQIVLGVVSGTALPAIMVRRLQDGDEGGHIRRALDNFPIPKLAENIINKYFIEGGRNASQPYNLMPMDTVEGNRSVREMTIVSNFVEVYLAKEGHNNAVGINYLEKIQLPHLPSIYGAMLAGVDYIIMGAGIPWEVPGILDSLSLHKKCNYNISLVEDKLGKGIIKTSFDPADFGGINLKPLKRPAFLPIISSNVLALALLKRKTGSIEGFVIELPTAGGHNAPPRGALSLTEDGQPIYSERDAVNLEKIKKLDIPFWLAGSYGSALKLKEALCNGAAGIQVGTAFAMSDDSGMDPYYRTELLKLVKENKANVFTDPLASPTGFPFKVARIPGTLSEKETYEKRKRICDCGFLREICRTESGTFIYRCAAEPIEQYLSKGGKLEETINRKCLCNALAANVGLGQVRGDSIELPLITCGDELKNVSQFLRNDKSSFSSDDVINTLLGINSTMAPA